MNIETDKYQILECLIKNAFVERVVTRFRERSKEVVPVLDNQWEHIYHYRGCSIRVELEPIYAYLSITGTQRARRRAIDGLGQILTGFEIGRRT